MKIAVKRLIRDEKGAAMILALLLLLVSGLIAAPLLSHMGSGLITGGVYEERTAELYAVDAGVEDAVWKIQHKDGYLPCSPGSPARNYTITDLNGKEVDVEIASVFAVDNLTYTYRVMSTTTEDGSGTQIEAYIEGVNIYGDYGDILGQVLTSQEEITLQPGTEVYPPEGEECGPAEYYENDWPTAEELIQFYLDDVDGEESYDSDMLEFNSDMELGPFYRDGELEIKAGTAGVTLTLTGTIYISGDTLIGSTGKDFTLNLNDCTIFIASNSSDPQKALWIGGKCTVVGSGVIIAIGDMYFEPNTEAGVTDPIFVMSVLGTTSVQPGGDFYGSIAGSVEIELQPGTSINYPESGGWSDDLNFLIGVKKLVYSIDSWEINQK
jgi:Flp pilus assembly pilin Flp